MRSRIDAKGASGYAVRAVIKALENLRPVVRVSNYPLNEQETIVRLHDADEWGPASNTVDKTILEQLHKVVCRQTNCADRALMKTIVASAHGVQTLLRMWSANIYC